jgi:hypothetical protein
VLEFFCLQFGRFSFCPILLSHKPVFNSGGLILKHSLFCRATLLAVMVLTMGFPGSGQTTKQTQISGSGGGRPFADTDIPSGARILEVRVSAGQYVDSVQVIHILADGRTLAGPVRGGAGGKMSTFRLDSDEYIVSISGRHGNYVDSLQLHTNKRSSPLYGGAGGRSVYRIEIPSGNRAVGLTGRAGNYIDALGLIFAPLQMQMAGQTRIAGGSGGKVFSDLEIPLDARIAEVRIHAGRYVDGIQAVYRLRDGSLLEAPFHGGRGGGSNVFTLEADEYIIALSGRHGTNIDSLQIHTNKRSSPLYGGTGGKQQYRIDVASGYQGIAFAGRAGRYIDAIGLNYAPVNSPAQNPGRQRPRSTRD